MPTLGEFIIRARRRLPPLELVDRAHGDVAEPGRRERPPQQPHLGVVRRDHHEVDLGQRTRRAVTVGPRAPEHPAHLARDALGLLRRGGHVTRVVHGQVPQPRTERGRLIGQLGKSGEPVVVHDLRDEPADIRMHAPRAVEEDPHLGRHRGMSAQEVLEHRGSDALGMGSLGDLGELQRIA
jgi:hypothetical protein